MTSKTITRSFIAVITIVLLAVCVADPALNIATPAMFGRVTAPLNRNFGTGTNRQMQFALRLNF